VIRPEADQIAAANKNYFTVQRWVDVSNENRGITVATIDAPLIEIGGMTAEEWTASPLKIWKNKTNSSSKIFSWVMNNSWHTNYKAEQEGVASFRYVLQSHKKFDYSKAYRFGVEQSQPLLFTNSENSINIEQIVSLDQNSTIVVTSLKPSRDGRGLIVRLYNPTDNTSKTALKTAKKYSKLYLSSGDEEETKPIDNKLIFAPFEVKTIKAIYK
jgi:alpha-mannosidase